ncbi:fumarylacetoacetate hydrolase family protein [Streptomyces europaeiscabiei]|uniref:2-keto-4-pentenoate hydratase n=1 Tax=Streptomyces europaeiscabiei TaxID=146819 RepID=UPI0029B2DB7B|nr:fumarylacetoacetate hydrolase family protein [Streptomyces europaeiscabiei]MDX3696588.1 fumarylacetoacetate hydrolase family protein [Streptomyces europaeiscabiei]
MNGLVERWARTLDDAATSRTAVAGPTELAEVSLADAYAVQREVVRRRLDRGESLAGFKLGFTSVAKMRQMGVHDLIHGRLTEGMRVADGGTVDVEALLHPRIEPEVAFLLGAPLGAGAEGTDPLAAVTAVAPALEVIDSRYAGFAFTLPEVIADNASSAGFAVGAWQPAHGIDLDNLGVLLEVDGRLAQSGTTAAILGHPLRSLTAAARLAAAAGLTLQPGWVILAGAATAAVPLPPGAHVRACVTGLGTVEVTASAPAGAR